MKYFFFICIIFCSFASQAQEFTSLAARTQFRGIVETETELLFYGEGIIWTDKNGKLIHKDRLLKGLPSSTIHDIQLDKEGNAWAYTQKGIGLIKSKDEMQTVFTNDGADGETYQFIYVDAKGIVYTASKNHIYKINPDLSKEIIYSNQDREMNYIKRMHVDQKGNILFTAYRDMYKVTPSGTLIKIKTDPRGKVNFQKIEEHKDGSITIVATKKLLTLKNDSLEQILHGNDLVNGLSFYHSAFVSKDHYMLLTTKGNIFTHQKGEWTNYIPPTNLRPGNYLDDILIASDGQIWVTMSEDPLLHFNGTEWNQIDLVQQESIKNLVRIPALADGRQIAQDPDSHEILEYQGDAFKTINSDETERVKYIRSGENGSIYWCTKLGLKKFENGKLKELVGNQTVNSFGLIGDKIVLTTDKLLQELKNGQLTDISSQNHFLGSSDLKYVKIYPSFKDELILVTNRKRGQLTLYDGTNWSKVIQIEGKKIGNVKDIITRNEQSYLFTEKAGIAVYDKDGFRWLSEGFEDPNRKRFSNYVCKDGALWSIDNKGTLYYYKDGKQLEIPQPTDRLYTSLRAVINTGEGTYKFFTARDVLQCEIK